MLPLGKFAGFSLEMEMPKSLQIIKGINIPEKRVEITTKNAAIFILKGFDSL